jgi:arylsulfatase A-like enzyme
MNRITRRGFLKRGAAATVAAGIGAPAVLRGAEKRKPNVLFIPVDDLRPQLPCFGRAQMIAPNFDKFAAAGTVFSRAYCQQAVCAPSRASLLTGLRPDSTGIYDLNTPVRSKLPNVLTMPEHFRKNGYHTARVGKVYHHHQDDKQGWSQMLSCGGKQYTDPATNKDMNERKKKAIAKGLKGIPLYNAYRGPATECADVPDNAYRDGGIADAALAHLKKIKDNPFFFAVGFIKPHLPFNAPKKYWDLYDPAKIELADNPFAPKDCPKIALHNWGELRAYLGIPKKGPVTDDQARKLVHGYYACVSYVDAQLGRLLNALDELELRDNTIVVLWGDHGWHLGDHGLWCKHSNFESAVHAPMMISAPGFKGGQKSNALTEFVDIYPSLCELTGLQRPDHLEGASFVPLMKNPDKAWKKAAFSQYPRGQCMGYSLRTDRYRYTEWLSKDRKTALGRELYDHEKDPAENVNLAGVAEHKATAARLSKMLKAGWKAAQPE